METVTRNRETPMAVSATVPAVDSQPVDSPAISVAVPLSPEARIPVAASVAGMDPRLPHDLHGYAEGRLHTDAGMAALAALDCDHADTLRAYGIGYLPADYHRVLTAAQRHRLRGLRLGGCLLLPAWDAQGVVVDVVAVHPSRHQMLLSLWPIPRGLCAPTVASACDRICITTVAPWVGRLFRTVAPTLLLRGIANAEAEVARIAAAGVRHAEVRCPDAAEADAIAALLRRVGIAPCIVAETDTAAPAPLPAAAAVATVEPSPAAAAAAVPIPAPAAALPSLELVSHDAQAEQAVFRVGPATYTVQLPWDGHTTVAVDCAVGAATHRDRFDLAVAPQRLRFAAAASRRTGLSPADIARTLDALLPAVQGLAIQSPVAASSAAPAPGMSDAQRAAALDLLRSPDLLPRLLADLDALGWVGDSEAKTLLLLAAISRLGSEPVWAALSADAPSERFPALAILAAITPPEHVLHVSRLTDVALFHGGPDALRHRLLILDDLGRIGGTAATALALLHTRGVLTSTQVERDPVRGGWRTRVIETRGPLAVLAATTAGIPAALRQTLVEVPVDDSPAQAEREFAVRTRLTGDAAPILARLIDAQRLLHPRQVALPADLAVPALVSRHRALHAPFCGLVAAAALLHQHQRLMLGDRVGATAADVDLASRAILPLAAQFIDGFGARAQTALAALRSHGVADVTLADLARLLPDWSQGTVRRAVEDLIAAGCVVALRRRNGVRATYRLSEDLVTLPAAFQAGWQAPTPAVAHG